MSHEPRADVPLARDAMPLPDANRARLEALLRELLRDESFRELFSRDEELASQSSRAE